MCVGGRDVVMLHGQPGSGSDWQQLSDQLSAGLRVVALDRPGYGTNRLAAGGLAVNARTVVAAPTAKGADLFSAAGMLRSSVGPRWRHGRFPERALVTP